MENFATLTDIANVKSEVTRVAQAAKQSLELNAGVQREVYTIASNIKDSAGNSPMSHSLVVATQPAMDSLNTRVSNLEFNAFGKYLAEMDKTEIADYLCSPDADRLVVGFITRQWTADTVPPEVMDAREDWSALMKKRFMEMSLAKKG